MHVTNRTDARESRWSATGAVWAWLAVPLMMALSFPPAARAACNALPDAELIFGTERESTVEAPAALPYRGAIGRIDRPIARAAIPAKRGGFATEYITVGADSVCGSPSLASRAGDDGPPSTRDYIVLIMFPPPPSTESGPTTVIALAHPDLHAGIREQAAAAESAVTLLSVRSNAGVTFVPLGGEGGDSSSSGDLGLRIEYPDVVDISRDGRTPITGPARIIVTRANEPLVFARTARECTRIAADDTFRPLICIDELFFDEINRCGTRATDLHPANSIWCSSFSFAARVIFVVSLT